jgi:adenosylcobinamide hydrolase
LHLYTLPNGDKVNRYKESIVINLEQKNKVLSTSHLNGGYQENLSAVFNHDITSGLGPRTEITPANYEQHLSLLAEELGLDPQTTAGLITSASMENVAICSESFRELKVTALVTGGIEVNGGRVGDPAFFYEQQGQIFFLPPGTINIILHINADLPAETMVRSLITATEAKTAALQELGAGSNYSSGLATGTGTDGAIVIANPQADLKLFYAGKHSKLGELIGLAVKAAVKEALHLESGLSPRSQFSVLKLFKRFGMGAEDLWRSYLQNSDAKLGKEEFRSKLTVLEREESLVIQTSLYVHLMDQMMWGLLSPEQAITAGKEILAKLLLRHAPDQPKPAALTNSLLDSKNPLEQMVEFFKLVMLAILKQWLHK